jgi:hypothetical protein
MYIAPSSAALFLTEAQWVLFPAPAGPMASCTCDSCGVVVKGRDKLLAIFIS